MVPQAVKTTNYFPLLHLHENINGTKTRNVGRINEDLKSWVCKQNALAPELSFPPFCQLEERSQPETDG